MSNEIEGGGVPGAHGIKTSKADWESGRPIAIYR